MSRNSPNTLNLMEGVTHQIWLKKDDLSNLTKEYKETSVQGSQTATENWQIWPNVSFFLLVCMFFMCPHPVVRSNSNRWHLNRWHLFCPFLWSSTSIALYFTVLVITGLTWCQAKSFFSICVIISFVIVKPHVFKWVWGFCSISKPIHTVYFCFNIIHSSHFVFFSNSINNLRKTEWQRLFVMVIFYLCLGS